jgi:hypothetical protein
MCSNNYSSEINQLSDNWGFYVDIENINPSIKSNDDEIREKYKINKFKNYDKKINNCETINEEREYYCKEENSIEEKDESNISNMIVNVSSTIFITAILTYFILFII